MPILDIEIVGSAPQDGAAHRIADAAAEVFGTGPRRTWVKLRTLSPRMYAENGAPPDGAAVGPVFVSVLHRRRPRGDALRRQVERLTVAVADILARPADRVHLLYEPDAAGRIAFGSQLVQEEPDDWERVSSGAPWEAEVGYCRAIRVGDRVSVTGTAPIDDEGAPYAPGDAEAQTARCLVLIERALGRFDLDRRSIVRTRLFVTDIERWPDYGRAHASFFGELRPATTMVEVSRLIDERMLIEIECEAAGG